MDTGAASRSFEEILTAVEQDEELKSGGAEAAEGDEQQPSTSSDAPMGLGGMLPPELLSRLPMLLKAVQSMTEPMPHTTGRPATPEALLCALRPYLGERRQQALDAMIRISRLSGTLGSLR